MVVNNVVAIAQARLGSTRLKNKMLMHLNGYSIIEWVYLRLCNSKLLNEIVFAIPDNKENDLLDCYLKKIGANVFRGSESDLVQRYIDAANYYEATHVVRVCCDRPLISPEFIDELIQFYFSKNIDYAFNHVPLYDSNWPIGLGAEISHSSLIKTISKVTVKPDHREHLYNYIHENRGDFSISTYQPSLSLSHPILKLDLDDQDDYKRLIERNYKIDMSVDQVIKEALKETTV